MLMPPLRAADIDAAIAYDTLITDACHCFTLPYIFTLDADATPMPYCADFRHDVLIAIHYSRAAAMPYILRHFFTPFISDADAFRLYFL